VICVIRLLALLYSVYYCALLHAGIYLPNAFPRWHRDVTYTPPLVISSSELSVAFGRFFSTRSETMELFV